MTLEQIWGSVLRKPVRHPYPAHLQEARQIAADGMVLLKNDNHTLPLAAGKVALFGAGAWDTATCGTGSGFVFAPYTVSVYQGLCNAGFTVTSESWLKRFAAAEKEANKKDKTLSKIDRTFSGVRILMDELPITDAELTAAKATDTAIYVIRRNAGENNDRKAKKGDYYLSGQEYANLQKVAGNFAHTIVILNTCVIDANFLFEIPGIDAAVLMGHAGCESGNALADVLTGKICPSGHLTDTWAKCYSDYPTSSTFAENDGNTDQEDYREDIFVGYRYFDTFGVEPLFPFGYGLSYTEFRQSVLSVEADWEKIRLEIQTENIGRHSGRYVTQVYVTAPEGKLPQPLQELKGFAKTGLLKPGQTEILHITIPTESLASYDAQTACFLMEKGDYVIRTGSQSRDAKAVHILRLNENAVVRWVSDLVQPDRELEFLTPPKRTAEGFSVPVTALFAEDCITIDGASKLPRKTVTYLSESKPYQSAKSHPIPFACEEEVCYVRDCSWATLPDVAAGKVTMEEFVASLDVQTLLRLVCGTANETKYVVPKRMKRSAKQISAPSSSGATTALFTKSLGIPGMYFTDGPAGLHLMGCGATCYPVGMVVAQTWDVTAAKKVGEGMGKELRPYNHTIILGPGMNIHRDPLCGRNFEYYAEDPLLTGKMGAAVTQGVQRSPGVGVAIKHFACNNQESNRIAQNSTVSQRALRELYLRGFEICVREASPKTVMTSYNLLNGVHTSSHYELLTDILRGEWGFDGLVMTDWGSNSEKPLDFHAGNDLIMGGYRSDFLTAAMEGTPPLFDTDGYVKSETHKVYGGFMTQTVEYWNTFTPMANGPDTVTTMVAPGVSLNEKVYALAKEGKAHIEELPDGSKRITYPGINKGAWLTLGDVQKCAMNVLHLAMQSISYEKM